MRSPDFTFVHAADLHLDSPLRGLERYPTAPIEAIRSATRMALRGLVDLCLGEEVDFLLIAGDLYDGDWRDYNTGLAFAGEMARLSSAGVRVVWIRGNHDAASQITRRLRLPEGVKELSADSAETYVLDDLGVAVHGQGYARREVTENLAGRYPAALPGLFNVGLLHTALEGRPGHASYAPCKLGDLLAQGYDYWALGHVHSRDIVHRDPWVVFPGNLQGRHIGECGAKGASLVRVEDGRVASLEHRALDVVRWARVQVDLQDVDGVEEALGRSASALHEAALAAEGRVLAARIELSGRCAVHETLVAESESWLANLRARAAEVAEESSTEIWIEKVKIETRSSLDMPALRRAGGPLAELLGSVAALEAQPAALAELLEELEALKRKLPPELRNSDDSTDPFELLELAGLAALLPETSALLAARLVEGEGA